MTAAEHVLWSRRRAHEYVDQGQPQVGMMSMLSDLGKHEETVAGVMGCALAAYCIDPGNGPQVRNWIDGCFPAVPVEAR